MYRCRTFPLLIYGCGAALWGEGLSGDERVRLCKWVDEAGWILFEPGVDIKGSDDDHEGNVADGHLMRRLNALILMVSPDSSWESTL